MQKKLPKGRSSVHFLPNSTFQLGGDHRGLTAGGIQLMDSYHSCAIELLVMLQICFKKNMVNTKMKSTNIWGVKTRAPETNSQLSEWKPRKIDWLESMTASFCQFSQVKRRDGIKWLLSSNGVGCRKNNMTFFGHDGKMGCIYINPFWNPEFAPGI